MTTSSTTVEVVCIDNWHHLTGRPYHYLRRNQKYKAIELARVYQIVTPRGLTHYPKRLFRKVGPSMYEYSPTQEGDRADDI